MIAVDMEEQKLFHDTEIKDALAAARPSANGSARSPIWPRRRAASPRRPVRRGGAAPRQVAAGYSIEELEQILAPMAEDGKETLASMGDDTPAAVLSSQYRPLSHFLPAELQPGDEPAHRQRCANTG
jgi:glutamate synthase (NADPH/NADH) large chain